MRRIAATPLLILAGALSSFAQTPVLSLNFVGSGTAMAATESAGVIPATGWVNATGAAGTVTSGGITTTWKCDNGYALPVADTAGNARMMRGYCDTGSGNPTTVTVSGLAAGTYNVTVYADGDNDGSTRSGTYSIGNSSATITDLANTNFSGTFTLAAPNGNYYTFMGIAGPTFTLTVTPGASPDVKRAPLNAIQIVSVAPPPPPPPPPTGAIRLYLLNPSDSVNSANISNYGGCSTSDTGCTQEVQVCDEFGNCLHFPPGAHTVSIKLVANVTLPAAQTNSTVIETVTGTIAAR